MAVEREGRRLVVSRRMDAPRERIWSLLRDTRRWPDWGPTVRAVECESRYIEAGTEGRVQTVGGLWITFEVTTCENYRWTWDVARVPATGHRAGHGTAAFEAPIWAAAYVPVCWRALERIERLVWE